VRLGQLTAKIAESGAEVMGIDRSAEMIAEARRNFPSLRFELGDATNFTVDTPFDAVFSNAALHWVKNADGAAASVARSLRSGGRFVMEMGGKGTRRQCWTRCARWRARWKRRGISPASANIRRCWSGMASRSHSATLFDCPTRVEGEDGLEDWLAMFAGSMLASAEARREVANRLRPRMFRDGAWVVDYRRLRVIVKCNH
jgi:trans-aconitate 2-methyltransferase